LVLLSPAADAPPRRDGVPALRSFWRLARPHRATMGHAMLGAVAYTLLGLAMSAYVRTVVDTILVDGDVALLRGLSVVMIALAVAQTAIGVTRATMTLRTGERIDAGLVLAYYRHLLALPQRFFDTRRAGEITSRIGDAVKIRAFINDVAVDFVVDACIAA